MYYVYAYTYMQSKTQQFVNGITMSYATLRVCNIQLHVSAL